MATRGPWATAGLPSVGNGHVHAVALGNCNEWELYTCVPHAGMWHHGGGRECWKHCTTSRQRRLSTATRMSNPHSIPPTPTEIRSERYRVRFDSRRQAEMCARTAGANRFIWNLFLANNDWRHRVVRAARGYGQWTDFPRRSVRWRWTPAGLGSPCTSGSR